MFNNVPITNQSSSGAYYSTSGGDVSNIDDTSILNIRINDFVGASSSFVPYSALDSNHISFISDVSQTVKSISVRVYYAAGIKKL